MQIKNFFISENKKNIQKNKLRLNHRKIISKLNPLKVHSKKIMNDYKKFGLNYFDNSKIGIGYGKLCKRQSI